MVAIFLASVARMIICFKTVFNTFSTTLLAFNNFTHSTNDALDCLIHKFQSKKAAIKCKSLCFPGRHLPSKCHGREIWGQWRKSWWGRGATAPHRHGKWWIFGNFDLRGLKTAFSSANRGGFVGNLKVLSEILEALPPTGKREFPPLFEDTKSY
jgi:hypothetical protein